MTEQHTAIPSDSRERFSASPRPPVNEDSTGGGADLTCGGLAGGGGDGLRGADSCAFRMGEEGDITASDGGADVVTSCGVPIIVPTALPSLVTWALMLFTEGRTGVGVYIGTELLSRTPTPFFLSGSGGTTMPSRCRIPL